MHVTTYTHEEKTSTYKTSKFNKKIKTKPIRNSLNWQKTKTNKQTTKELHINRLNSSIDYLFL